MFGWKKYSAKTQAAAADWLRQFDQSLESLSEARQEAVLRHVKRRRIIKWHWISGIAVLVCLFAGIYGCFVSSDVIQLCLEYIADAGKDGIEPEMLHIVKFNLYSIITMPFMCFGMALFYSVLIVSDLYNTFKNEKTLSAFLRDDSAGNEAIC